MDKSRTFTTSSNNSGTNSDGDIDSDGFDNSNGDLDAPSISRIFVDAAKYEKMLVRAGCCSFLKKLKKKKEATTAPDGDGDGGDSTSADQEGDSGSDVDVEATAFEDLVGRDLSPSEHAIAGRLAKLSVTSSGHPWTPSAVEQTEEPESYEDEEDEEVTTSSTLAQTSTRTGTSASAGSTTDDKSWQLTPENVVELVVQEFGELASGDEKEELLLETDAGLFLDVAIIGVVHVTTHRLTFHASLLAARPDLLPSQQVIKAGPAILHRKGLRLKRRVWLELSHDMLCTYNRSNDAGRIHPFRTLLLSSIREIGHADHKHPKTIRIGFRLGSKDMDGIVEFTTEEAANDWRRELQGALFIYRHTRRRALDGDGEEESTGVRLNIPLHSIEDVRLQSNPVNSMLFASLDIPLSQIEHSNGSGCGKQQRPGDDASSSSEQDEPQTIRVHLCPVAPFAEHDQWARLPELVAASKERHRERHARDGDNHELEEQPVFVDFGPFSFCEEDVKVVDSHFVSSEERAVRRALALSKDLDLWIVKARTRRGLACSGYFVVSSQVVGFWSKFLTQSDIRYRIAISTVKLAKPANPTLFFRNGVTLEVDGHHDLAFEFKSPEIRDEAIRRVNEAVRDDREATLTKLMQMNSPTGTTSSSSTPSSTSTPSSSPSVSSTPTAVSSSAGIPSPSWTGVISPISRTLSVLSTIEFPSNTVPTNLPKAINVPSGLLFSRPSSHYVCLTIGSRGDVQPYIALGLRLKKEGHSVTIVTHEEYREWVEGFGITHRQAGGDPAILMKLSVDNKMFSPEFFKESFSKFRPWLDQLLEDAWTGCQGADVLLESPSAMAGVHIAEALKIPYFRSFTMPWTKTTQFPHAFLSPPVSAPTFNSLSYILFDNVMWAATSGQINRWRRNTLKLGATDMGHLAQSKITFIYNFSQAVVPKPLDWGDTTVISGYWFLDNPELNWTPPQSLLEWMEKARNDGKPIVYIGFGSITVPHPNRTTSNIVKAVLKSDVRAIISKGWSARLSKDSEQEVEMPPECYQLDKVPHDWLFPRVDAALHHGGAGTTGASLRAGIPTLIKPWFGDQFFWASRVQQLGAGLRVPTLRVSDLAAALTRATTSRVMKEKAASVGERIRSEDGLHTAIQTIYTYQSRAARDRKTLN